MPNMPMRIIISAFALLLYLFFAVSAQDLNNGLEQYVNESQLALDVYLDESGKALIVGYATQEILNSMGFLKTSEYIYNNETNELYCLTDKLTWKTADLWTFNFTSEGYIKDFNLMIYFPKKAMISKIEYSSNIDYHLTSENESLVLETNGFEVQDPTITINYSQPKPILTPSPPQNLYNYALPLAIFSILIIASILFLHRRKALRMEREELEEQDVTLRQPEIAIEITPEMKKVIETLSQNEKNVIELLIKSSGKLTQSKIRYETRIPKSSLAGIISSLERKKIIEKTKYGKTNVIELSKWFLSKNKKE